VTGGRRLPLGQPGLARCIRLTKSTPRSTFAPVLIARIQLVQKLANATRRPRLDATRQMEKRVVVLHPGVRGQDLGLVCPRLALIDLQALLEGGPGVLVRLWQPCLRNVEVGRDGGCPRL